MYIIFAEDTVIYLEITIMFTLQADKKFNGRFILKMQHSAGMTIQSPSMYNHTVNGTTIKELEEVKYLGIHSLTYLASF